MSGLKHVQSKKCQSKKCLSKKCLSKKCLSKKCLSKKCQSKRCQSKKCRRTAVMGPPMLMGPTLCQQEVSIMLSFSSKTSKTSKVLVSCFALKRRN